MEKNFIEVDLNSTEKRLIMELASFYVFNEITLSDLKNGRKKWIRFNAYTITDVIGELSYHFNRCNNMRKSEILDELICHLEFYEKK